GIELSPGTFVALLLLIGYSVDTDILLTTRLLVRKTGTFEERLSGAMKTGLTMNATTMAAVLVILLASTSVILKEIAVVILIGLMVDLINTWIQNAGILHWYVTRGGK
ncbi:MAG: preprotein translocase subunit SecF, partial [Anaerolineae bacterium]